MAASKRKSQPIAAGDAGREQSSGALARGLSVLREMLLAPQPLTLGEIANLTNLDQSTALRLLRSLEASRHVIRLADSKRYAPSPLAMFPLPLLHPLQQVRREAQPLIERLATSFKESVVFVLYIETERMVLDIAQSANSLSPYYSSWLNGPLHATASGKALLLGLGTEERRSLLGPEPFAATTPHSLITFDALEADLALSAERGYVVTRDEHHQGLTALATNLPDLSNRLVGCLCVTGHTRDFDDARIKMVGEELQAAAKLMPYQATSLRGAAHFIGK